MSDAAYRLLGWLTWRGIRLYLRRRFSRSGRRIGIAAVVLVVALGALIAISQRRVAQAR